VIYGEVLPQKLGTAAKILCPAPHEGKNFGPLPKKEPNVGLGNIEIYYQEDFPFGKNFGRKGFFTFPKVEFPPKLKGVPKFPVKKENKPF